jgi:hypothetical protein
MAAAFTVPLASGGASAATAKPQGFNKAVAAKFIRTSLSHAGSPIRGAQKVHGLGVKAGTTNYQSTNWSGYADLDSTFSKVSATWVEPAITCNKKDKKTYQLAAFWVGIDGFSSSTVEQDGTIEECYGAKYLGAADWWEMYPTNDVQIVNDVATGDTVAASVTINKAGKYVLAVKDKASSASFTTTQACGSTPCGNSSAEWIGEAPCCSGSDVYDLADWSPAITFSKAAVAGAAGKGTISTYDHGADIASIDMVGDVSGNPTATVSSLNSKGNSFIDTWEGQN